MTYVTCVVLLTILFVTSPRELFACDVPRVASLAHVAAQALCNHLKAHDIHLNCYLHLIDSSDEELPPTVNLVLRSQLRPIVNDRLQTIKTRLYQNISKEHVFGFRKTDDCPECCTACYASMQFHKDLESLSNMHMLLVILASDHFNDWKVFMRLLHDNSRLYLLYQSLPSVIASCIEEEMHLAQYSDTSGRV